MPWGEGPGALPPMRQVSGGTLVRMAAEAAVHQVIGADELEREETAAAWHAFADLMRDIAENAPTCGDAALAALADRVDATIADLGRVRARVVAGLGGHVLFVAVLPIGDRRRDLRLIFAAG